jgi:phosphohistidine phosphatase
VRTLIVLRHAKSSWGETGLPDHDRPLAPRGRRAGAALARHVAEAGVAPELVLCSTALRARQTLDLVLPALGEPQVSLEAGMYLASAEAIVERLRVLTAEVVMLVGHNPGLQDLVLHLSRAGPLRDLVAGKFPTGALATLEVDILAEAGATLVDLVVPRELAD